MEKLKGKYRIYSANSYLEGNKKCLTVEGNSPTDCARIVLDNFNGQGNQIFEIIKSQGIYIIKSVSSFKVLDVCGAREVDGAGVIQYHLHGEKNQQWKISKVNIPSMLNGLKSIPFYYIQTAMNDYGLSIKGNGAIISSSQEQQLFIFEKVEEGGIKDESQ